MKAMSEVQKQALNRAIATLNALAAAGVSFVVRTPEGDVGELQYAGSRRNFRQYGYIDEIKAMSVGEVKEIEIPADVLADDEAAQSFAISVSAAACRHIGPGNYATARVGNKVEVLRVA